MKFSKYLILFLLIAITSCKQEKEVNQDPKQEPIFIQFNTYWGDKLMHPDSTYFDHENRPFQLYDFNILFTNLQLIDEDNDTIDLPRDRFMTKLGQNNIFLQVFKKQNFSKFYVRFGVDSLTNSTIEPTMIQDSSDPFYPQMPAMWWTWAHGFIFTRIEGYTDWSENYGNKGIEIFGYHLGAFNFDRRIGPFQSKLSNGQSSISLKLDVKKIFDNLDFPDDNSSHSFDNPKLTEKIIQLICKNIEEDL